MAPVHIMLGTCRFLTSLVNSCSSYVLKFLDILQTLTKEHARNSKAYILMKETGYHLRNLPGVVTRRKRAIECLFDLPTARHPARKRIRRSHSVSSQKENSAPQHNKRTIPSARPRLDHVKTRLHLNTISEHAASSSTPVQRPMPLFSQTVGRSTNDQTRLTRSCSTRESLASLDNRRILRSTRRSLQSAPNAELRVELERVPVNSRPVLRSDVTNSSSHSTPQSSPTELLTMDTSLLSWFSPRRFNSIGKDQAAKLKRLNTRRIEFDLHELSQSMDHDVSQLTTESLLNQSIVGDPIEKLLGLCGQTEVKPFEECFDNDTLDGIVKIGEGVYGEVFQSPKGHVIKIFPVDGEELVNGEKQMAFADVYPEVFVSKKLSELAYKYRRNRSVNFAQLKKATVVRGALPEAFGSSWRKFEAQRGSENECPDFLPPSQQWIVLEFEFAGEPLANVRFNTCREARSVIEQIALSLAAAESALQFEHRDLHWHNILVRPTRQWKLRYRVGGVSYAVFTEGIQVTIIDFTVSRLCHEGNIVYVDMADSPEIFECEGDYQFDIYRIMRDLNGNDWRPFNPVTNLYWLHYLMGKLLNETSYPRRDPDSQPVESELRALYDMVLTSSYKSAMELVSSSFYFDTCRIG
ncbi:Serine/threonine-protein kinase haspin [Paragonimus heterotremus]|uniref:non-specific serine/threonine protein kinase n=1 Tax=Paragonimus heterotremus TaxID=100268 RepID=A0A8J4TGI4_9TREM|nr:Serine/threonine-protein kinase haspin [Paragonimus heterotremus]